VTCARQDILYWRDPVLGVSGTELAYGRSVQRPFGPLIRDEATVAVVLAGALHHRIGGHPGIASAGQVLLIPAGESFAGEADATAGWSWRVFYPDLDTLAAMSGDGPPGPPVLGPQPAASPLQENAALARRLATLHRAIALNAANPLARQQAFAAAMAAVLWEGAHPPDWPRRPRPDNKAVRRAIDCVRARFHDPALGVAELAAAAGYSPYYFMRLFQGALGVTVHDYVVQCRLHATRVLLAKGLPAAEAAQAAGFSDQSHLIRQFKAVLGVTPGQYAEESRRLAVPRPAAPGRRPTEA
jgi:AraC-like DNA-binding protein